MSKIICDVCGTSFPETATQCPICGCVRAGEVKTVSGDTNVSETGSSGTYTYVKGGRFSKSNVRKRNREMQNSDNSAMPVKNTEEKKEGNEKGLTIAVVVLLLAVVAVVLYIMIRIFGGGLFITDGPDKNTGDVPGESSSVSVPSTELNIPCTGLTIDNPSVELQKKDSAYLLNVTVSPADTTDEVIYASADETIATVTPDGKVVAVGAGETKIIITCGEVEIECAVVCSFDEEPTDPSEEATDPSEEATEPSEEPTDPSVPDADFKLNREDFTLAAKGTSWNIYDGSDAEQITWTSDNEAVATIENGNVVAVGPGMTTVHGEYNGVKLSCIVRCSFKDVADAPANEPEQNTESSAYTMSHTDVTIIIGESFTLQLFDANGTPATVTWRTSDGCCSISGNRITGASNGTAKVYTTHGGREYSCIVRVFISR